MLIGMVSSRAFLATDVATTHPVLLLLRGIGRALIATTSPSIEHVLLVLDEHATSIICRRASLTTGPCRGCLITVPSPSTTLNL